MSVRESLPLLHQIKVNPAAMPPPKVRRLEAEATASFHKSFQQDIMVEQAKIQSPVAVLSTKW